MAPICEVHSYHINVGAGDCAVHLLVKKQVSVSFPKVIKPAKFGNVLSAVMIDGGKSGVVDLQVIPVFREIATYYDFEDGSTTLTFDSIVITHWDSDHYGGVLSMILEDLEDKTINDATKSSYMKYDGTTRLTTMYAPYWNSADSELSDILTPSKTHKVGTVKTAKGGNNYYGMLVDGVLAPYLCFLKDGAPDVIGVNLFDGSTLKSTQPYTGIKKVSDLTSMFNRTAPKFGFEPGLFCVSCDGRVIGVTSSLSSMNALVTNKMPISRVFSGSNSGLISNSLDSGIPGGVGLIPADHSGSNKSSIGALVIWPSVDEVSHYTAGDAEEDTEKPIMEFVTNSGLTRVPCMKLSHHGAVYSTPVEMISTYQPDFIICSSGTQYYHPRWEFAYLINTWIRWKIGTNLSIDQKYPETFLPLGYPYWLIREREGTNYLKDIGTTSTFSDTDALAYRTQIQGWLTTIGDPFLTNAAKAKKDYSSADVQNLILSTWDSISKVAPENTLFPGTTAINSGRVATTDNTIRYHLLVMGYDTAAGQTVQKVYTFTQGGLAPPITSPQVAPVGPTYSSSTSTGKIKTAKNTVSYNPLSFTLPGVPKKPSRITRSSYKNSSIKQTPQLQDPDQTEKFDPEQVRRSQALTLPVLLDPPPPTGTFFFVSSTASLSPIITAGKYHQFSAPSAIDNFFQMLRNDSVTLASAPTATASWVPLANSDEWLYWMKFNGFQASGINVLAENGASNSSPGITGFQITLAIQPSITSAPGIHKYPWNMTFSTDSTSIESNFPVIQGHTGDVFEDGVAKNFPVIIAGLDSVGTDFGDCNIYDIINMFSLPYGQAGFVGLATDLKLALDTTAGARNAIWFGPGSNYVTALRLQFSVTQESVADLQGILNTVFGTDAGKNPKLLIISPTVIARKNNSYIYMGDGAAPGDIQFAANVTSEMIIGATFQATSGGITYNFSGYMDFKETSLELTITFNDSNVQLGTIITVINSLVSKYCTVPLPVEKLTGDAAKLINDAIPACFRELSVSIADDGSGLAIKSVVVVMEIPMHIGSGNAIEGNIVFFMSYSWPNDVFSASLYPTIPLQLFNAIELQLLPDYEVFRDLKPVTTNLVPYLSLMNLIPGDSVNNAALPDGIPDILEAVSFTVQPGSISFYGEIACLPPKTNSVPAISIDFVTLTASYGIGAGVSGPLQISMFAEVTLTARQPVPVIVNQGKNYSIPTAVLLVNVNYDSKNGWGVSGEVQDLSLGCLYSYIEKGYEGAMMDVLERIMLKELSVTYEHDANGSANHFTFLGVIYLGGLELDLTYDYNSASDPIWSFNAVLKLNSGKNTSSLFEVLESVIGSDVLSMLPPCANIPITPDSGSGTGAIELHVVKSKSKNDTLMFRIRFNLGGGASLSFIQMSQAAPGGTSTAPTKRMFRFSVNPMPGASGIPLVGSMPQPFDEMDFVWVHDAGPNAGLLRSEVNLLNTELLTDPGEALRFKDLYQPNSNPPPPDNVIFTDGSHFIIVFNNKVVLDYAFGQANASEASASSDASMILANSATGTVSGQATMAPMSKTIGPLAIQNVGLKYDSGTLWLIADAIFTLGPIGFSLIGFGIGFDVSKFNLHNWSSVVPSWTLKGLGLEFNEPPVEIAGEFLHIGSLYMGGLTVAFDPYAFTAVGAYGTVTDKDLGSFETVFLYGQLDGPLIQIEVIEISGLKIGFGLNSKVTYPDASQIQYFPFTADADQAQADSKNPLLLLDAFCTATASTGGIQWIVPTPDCYWLAIGLDAVAFEILNVAAIVILEFNPYVSLGVFAHGVAAIPETATSPSEAFAWVDFGIVATVDFKAGTFTDEGVLLPNSFVLSPSCHLTGGYAGCTWFGFNPYAGQWVYTVGGYHAAFKRPEYFPNPPRLGIYWSLGSDISISGEAYFAVTPKVCMGGGCLHALFSCGALSAHFDAWADFLICLHPFYFQGDLGVSVGVSFTLDLWICTIHINVDIGASVYLMGPPFRGTVHVDFWVFGFDINFGDGDNNTDPMAFADFLGLLRQVNQQDPSGSPSAGPDSALILGVQTGNVPSKGTIQSKQLAQWFVRAGTFTFRIQTRLACTTVSCNKTTNAASSINASGFTTDSVYSTPMHVSQPITSELAVTVTPGTVNPWRLTPVMKNVPQAVWAQYSDANNPTAPGSQGNQIDNLLDASGPTVNLMLGVTLQVPLPYKSNDIIPCFNAIEAMKSDINTTDPILSQTPPAQSKWLPRVSTPGEVALKWKSAQAMAQPFVDAWVSAFGWDSPDLKGPAPDTLIAGYESFYMEDPSIASTD